MPPSAVILHRDVLDGGCAVLAKVVRQLRVEPADRVEAIEDIDPLTAHRLAGKPRIAAPPRPQLVLDFVEAERAAERNEDVNPGALRNPLQAVVGDYGAHAVGDHDMRPRTDRRAYGVDEALPDSALDRHGCAARRTVDKVEKIMSDIGRKGMQDWLLRNQGSGTRSSAPCGATGTGGGSASSSSSESPVMCLRSPSRNSASAGVRGWGAEASPAPSTACGVFSSTPS